MTTGRTSEAPTLAGRGRFRSMLSPTGLLVLVFLLSLPAVTPRLYAADEIEYENKGGKGGTIGITPYAPFIRSDRAPTLEDYVDHFDYVIKLIGEDHVTLATDMFDGKTKVNWATPWYYPEITRGAGYGTRRVRSLVLDGLTQSGMDVDERLSVYEYTYHMQFLPRSMRPEGRTALAIGLGAGLIPGWYAARGVRTDVVEINPDVVELAREHFGWRPSGRVRIEDARRVLREAGESYDLVILDVFTGDATPGHLLTREALQDLRSHLAPGGLVALNLAGSLRTETFGTASLVKTLETVFASVRLHPTFDPGEGEGWGNIVVLASDAPPPPAEASLGASLLVHPMARPAVERFLRTTFRFPPGTAAEVLTDDGPPLDLRDVWLRERIRRGLLEATEWSVLS